MLLNYIFAFSKVHHYCGPLLNTVSMSILFSRYKRNYSNGFVKSNYFKNSIKAPFFIKACMDQRLKKFLKLWRSTELSVSSLYFYSIANLFDKDNFR